MRVRVECGYIVVVTLLSGLNSRAFLAWWLRAHITIVDQDGARMA